MEHEETKLVIPHGRHIVLRREFFDQIVEVIRSRPIAEAGHLLPYITDGEDKAILPNGGEVLDLADVIARIDAERSKHDAEKPEEAPVETEDQRKAARLARASERAEAS